MQAAVLTGDIVKSTKAARADLDACFAALSGAAETCADWHGAPLCLTRFRGDGWQVLLARPELALRSALFFQARLKADGVPLDTRIAIGLGSAVTGDAPDLSTADGTAFHNAGRALDTMARNRRLVLATGDAPDLAPGLVTLLDAIQQNWGREQAEALLWTLPPDALTQTRIAERLGIRQQSVADRLQAARFWAVEEALAAFEANLATLQPTK